MPDTKSLTYVHYKMGIPPRKLTPSEADAVMTTRSSKTPWTKRIFLIDFEFASAYNSGRERTSNADIDRCDITPPSLGIATHTNDRLPFAVPTAKLDLGDTGTLYQCIYFEGKLSAGSTQDAVSNNELNVSKLRQALLCKPPERSAHRIYIHLDPTGNFYKPVHRYKHDNLSIITIATFYVLTLILGRIATRYMKAILDNTFPAENVNRFTFATMYLIKMIFGVAICSLLIFLTLTVIPRLTGISETLCRLAPFKLHSDPVYDFTNITRIFKTAMTEEEIIEHCNKNPELALAAANYTVMVTNDDSIFCKLAEEFNKLQNYRAAVTVLTQVFDSQSENYIPAREILLVTLSNLLQTVPDSDELLYQKEMKGDEIQYYRDLEASTRSEIRSASDLVQAAERYEAWQTAGAGAP